MEVPRRIIALMYHRISENDTDPWGICVSPDHFEKQVRVLKNEFSVITTAEAVQQVTAGNIPQNSVCLTFDDGYEDNYTHALPVLKNYRCPATFFIATAFTGSSIPFWWDELEMICLHTKRLPAQLSLNINNALHHLFFETELTEKDWQHHLTWQWHEEPVTMRCRSFLSIWSLLRPLPFPEIENKMNHIRIWAGADFNARLPMSEEQLHKLCSEELATIGLHTHTHPDLASGNSEMQARDICMGKEILSSRYQRESHLLAYPYGSYNDQTTSAVEKCKIKGGFTTEQNPVTIQSDVMKLGRYQVFDWDAQHFTEQLRKWMSE